MQGNEDRDLFLAEAAMGQDAEDFLKSDIGRFIIGRCEQEIREAHDELSTVWAWRKNRIRDLQAKVWRAQSLTNWLGSLIVQGRQAATMLEQDNDE